MPTKRSRPQISAATGARALRLLEGTWRTDGHLVDAPPGPQSMLTAVDRYEWIPGLPLLAHYVAGHLGRTSVASFEVWSYDSSRRLYASTSFDEHGEPSGFEGRLRGREWSINGPMQRFRGTFAKDGRTLEGTWEQKSGGKWKPWLTITLRKAGA